jgi:hypothetical protein
VNCEKKKRKIQNSKSQSINSSNRSSLSFKQTIHNDIRTNINKKLNQKVKVPSVLHVGSISAGTHANRQDWITD